MHTASGVFLVVAAIAAVCRERGVAATFLVLAVVPLIMQNL